MSVFEGATLADNSENVVTDNFLEHLVGEGKKFDGNEALAKGKYEGDKHIVNLERQLSELRSDLETSSKLDDMMNLLREQKEAEPAKEKVPDDTSSAPMTSEELQAMIESTVSKRDSDATRTRNLAEVDKFMNDKFGEAAPRVVSTKASELGMTNDELQAIAASNPKVFAQLIGVVEAKKLEGSTTVGGVRGETVNPNLSGADTRNFTFYQEMRKKNKAAYYSPKVQSQMMKDREELGEAAFNN